MINKFWIFDTNTLLSALLNEDSPPGMALKKARNTGTLLLSVETGNEYFAVFCRPKFEKYLSLETRITASRDPKDDKFLSLAVSSGADAIVTGDKDLLVLHPFRNIPVLSPADFLNSIF